MGILIRGGRMIDAATRKFDSLFSSNTSQSLYWLYFFVKIKLYLYTLHYVVV